MAVTNSSVAVPAQSGKNLDTSIVNTSAGAVHRQAVVIADPETADRVALINGAVPVNVVNNAGNGLTDAELRATAVPVSVSGVATAAKQLPDGHNVTVLNPTEQGLTDAELRATPLATTNTALDAKIPDLSGTWGYATGTAGTVALTGGKRPLQITAMAGAVNATLSVNGGGDIFIPALTQFTFEPRGNLVDPTIIFTNTQSYVVEFIV